MNNLFDAGFLKSLGVIDWGYTESKHPKSYTEFSRWLESGHQGKLGYLADHRSELRKDLSLIFPQLQSTFVFLFPYERKTSFPNGLKVASYALAFEGKDYHHVLKSKLEKIASALGLKGSEDYKIAIDTEAILERDFAVQSGLGWVGKNSMLISKKHGSYFFIATLLSAKKFLNPKNAMDVDHCGNCRACLDACPTKAITENRTLIANQCISTFTIETFKDEGAPVHYENVENEIFGCDICQEVCPWNRSTQLKEHDQNVVVDFFSRSSESILQDLDDMSNREFKRKFSGTSLSRTGRVGIIKNLRHLKKNKDT